VEDALAFERVIAEHAGSRTARRLAGQRDPALLQAGTQAAGRDESQLIALIEPGSCFAGALLELALACDRQYMLDGLLEEDSGDGPAEGEPAQLVLSESNFGAFPMSNGLSRLGSRFYGDDDYLAKLRQETGRRLLAAEALELGLVTDAPDDIDWEDEVRIMLEEARLAVADALTGMGGQPPLRRPGDDGVADLLPAHAWQNWIFVRPTRPAGRRAAPLRHRPPRRIRPQARLSDGGQR